MRTIFPVHMHGLINDIIMNDNNVIIIPSVVCIVVSKTKHPNGHKSMLPPREKNIVKHNIKNQY